VQERERERLMGRAVDEDGESERYYNSFLLENSWSMDTMLEV
jgi:hypothetical protein